MDDDFVEKIIGVGKQFRPFSEAMDDFLVHHGYNQDVHDVKAKVDFINNAFKAAGIKPPRFVKKWYEEGKSTSRETAYQICFAFGLDATETDDFFRRYYACERGFDCHRLADAVYYCCMLNGWTYAEAEEIIKTVEAAPAGAGKAGEVVYTQAIMDDLKEIVSKEDLIAYLSDNKNLFSENNNLTAYKTIQTLWSMSVGENGLLQEEREKLSSNLDDLTIGKAGEVPLKPIKSTSDAFIALFQLEEEPASRILEKYRSVGPILKNLNEHIRDSFPNEQGIEKILRNDHTVSYESIRKWLILLSFYTFWAKTAVSRRKYIAKPEDRERCVSSMKNYLVDAGYSELYEGNPYDWLFFFAMADEDPLPTFRWIWQSLLDKMQEEQHRQIQPADQ